MKKSLTSSSPPISEAKVWAKSLAIWFAPNVSVSALRSLVGTGKSGSVNGTCAMPSASMMRVSRQRVLSWPDLRDLTALMEGITRAAKTSLRSPSVSSGGQPPISSMPAMKVCSSRAIMSGGVEFPNCGMRMMMAWKTFVAKSTPPPVSGHVSLTSRDSGSSETLSCMASSIRRTQHWILRLSQYLDPSMVVSEEHIAGSTSPTATCFSQSTNVLGGLSGISFSALAIASPATASPLEACSSMAAPGRIIGSSIL
mmetsp:Transcript_22686/g.41068  ORF Transcript_22686/g.41068 Transcript_22686/m.41068 type:complete len:255 (-) Transcript_22686:878-1642(-)